MLDVKTYAKLAEEIGRNCAGYGGGDTHPQAASVPAAQRALGRKEHADLIVALVEHINTLEQRIAELEAKQK